jgi:hypothetical protein
VFDEAVDIVGATAFTRFAGSVRLRLRRTRITSLSSRAAPRVVG